MGPALQFTQGLLREGLNFYSGIDRLSEVLRGRLQHLYKQREEVD